MRKIFIVTDYDCNNLCISCAKRTNEKGRLSFKQIVAIIDEIKPSEEDYIEISGGEPTLRDDFIGLCRYIKETYSTTLVILSNGRKFQNLEFAKNIKKAGVDRVMTTFYSPIPEVHDNITQQKGSFFQAFKGLKNLEEIGMSISVKTIVLKQNYKDLPKFVEFAYSNFPSAWVSIHGLILRGKAYDNYKKIVINHNKIKPYLEKSLDIAIEKNKNLGIFVMPNCIIDPFYWKYLSIGWKQMAQSMIYISPEERVFGNIETSQPYYCHDCLMGEDCSWAWESAWKEYINLFGTWELNKVIERDYTIIIATKSYINQISKIMLNDLANPDKKFSKEIIDQYREHAQENNLIKEFENPNLISFLAIKDNKVLDFIVGYKEKNTAIIHYISGNNVEIKRDLIRRFIEECKERNITKIIADSFEFMQNDIIFKETGFKIFKKEKFDNLELLWYKFNFVNNLLN